MRKLKREYNTTMVSMTDTDGRTGNVDYRDKREPSDEDLVQAAGRYGLTKGIRFTITTVVGVKTRFTADIVDGKLVRTSDVKVNTASLEDMKQFLYLEEKQKLEAFVGINLFVDSYLMQYGLEKKDIQATVDLRRKGLWLPFGDEYVTAMRNCVIAERILEVVK